MTKRQKLFGRFNPSSSDGATNLTEDTVPIPEATDAVEGARVLMNEVMRTLLDVAVVDAVVETPEDVADGRCSRAEDAGDEKAADLAADDVGDAVSQVTVSVTVDGSIDMFLAKRG
ncbi:hypothetical protein MMC17_007037 [Xylographa soralifera]|nr:hypothetical protein [Xylographa soralifera]